MNDGTVRFDLMDGPTLLIENGGLRLLTDPTFGVARRFDIAVAVLFAGSAQARGPFNVTMSANDVIEAAFAFSKAQILTVPHNLYALPSRRAGGLRGSRTTGSLATAEAWHCCRSGSGWAVPKS